ncbi:FCD domain-containing protein [Virgibacillus dakarensis]|uniref:GntR family transcriptional regulator n=1 Tax=Lentibacillus populi TaxID=1827502 RepID=A0A9W5TYN7_9BACI|nr:FadR/GntR family transcriptional regulator [Lentibacillus populi]MTW88322.1 FCD domain-containing protein [Virgibacillus dakarensis]GGB48204.1 GntR family transcriptional regulator [Lentibacillus populi]
MEPLFEKIPQRDSICEMIINQFTKMIKKGELEIGDKIPPERNLAEQFGVGRSTIREAIKSMTSMGLLEARLGEGTFVRKVDSDDIKQQLQWGLYLDPVPFNELVELRKILELETVKKAALNRTEKEISEMESWINAMKKDLKANRNKKNDLMFHMTIAKASDNKMIYNLLDLIRMSLEEWFENVLEDPTNVENSINEHELILGSIIKQDVDQAVKYMESHLALGEQRLFHRIELNKKD